MIDLVFSLLITLYILWCCLIGRIDNENVWGIYIKNKTIDIGDFWLSLAVIYFFIATVVDGHKLWIKFIS